MKIALLTSDLLTAHRHYREYKHLSKDIELKFLVIRSPNRGTITYWLSIFKAIIKIVISGKGEFKFFFKLVIFNNQISDIKCLSFLEKSAFDIGLHAYPVIYSQKIIDMFGKGILNAHIGKLPELQGRSVLEWGLILGKFPAISTFFITPGIDTGTELVHLKTFQNINTISIGLNEFKEYLFNQDAKCYAIAIENLVRGSTIERIDPSKGLRFYRMSDLMLNIAGKEFLDLLAKKSEYYQTRKVKNFSP
ncbi:hypothetical protein OA385_05090 [Paracoccaceae bacterium]|nr:hypothetical protein [Paracoccaceae bacterium]